MENGDHQNNGNILKNILFENIDVLEQHEPQENYWRVMAICAGDNNTVRNVTFHNIRVDDFESPTTVIPLILRVYLDMMRTVV